MDLNIYNIHYVVGLFVKPKNIEYHANIERGIDKYMEYYNNYRYQWNLNKVTPDQHRKHIVA